MPACPPARLPARLSTCQPVFLTCMRVCACVGKYYFGFCKGEAHNVDATGQPYDDGVPCTVQQAALGLPLEDAAKGYCGERVLNSASMLWLAQQVERGRIDKTVAGTTGLSPFARWLPHISYVDFFPLPVAHAFLLGLVRDFWEYVGTLPVRCRLPAPCASCCCTPLPWCHLILTPVCCRT